MVKINPNDKETEGVDRSDVIWSATDRYKLSSRPPLLKMSDGNMEICILAPEDFEDRLEVAEKFLDAIGIASTGKLEDKWDLYRTRQSILDGLIDRRESVINTPIKSLYYINAKNDASKLFNDDKFA